MARSIEEHPCGLIDSPPSFSSPYWSEPARLAHRRRHPRPRLPLRHSLPETATRLEIQLTDAFKVEPAEVTVPVGRAVTFVVTNAGAIAHEFYVGDEAAQAAHEKEMSSMGGMGHEDANGIALKPGETRELTITFAAPGKIIAGCHEPGHYAGGMKATIEIGS